ncbi:MAG: hypothetical protein JXR95_13355 [Deltaproteobacteria bacterium]|nr:hypothetical protein [Deltaproteobacteria bacterium]
MKKTVLISIHPEHVTNILLGKKIFEYRKVMPKQNVTHLALYATSPVKKIVALTEVINLEVDTPSEIWIKTGHGSGITHEFYNNYFSKSVQAGYFAIGKVYILKDPIELSKLSSCKVPPQSFCYLNDADTKSVMNKDYFESTYCNLTEIRNLLTS